MIWEPVSVCSSGVSVAVAARGSVMLFIGEATLFSSVPGTAGDDSLRENCEEVRALKLKNPRTSVGAGAFNLAAFLGQPGHRTRANQPEDDETDDHANTTRHAHNAAPSESARLRGHGCGSCGHRRVKPARKRQSRQVCFCRSRTPLSRKHLE